MGDLLFNLMNIKEPKEPSMDYSAKTQANMEAYQKLSSAIVEYCEHLDRIGVTGHVVQVRNVAEVANQVVAIRGQPAVK